MLIISNKSRGEDNKGHQRSKALGRPIYCSSEKKEVVYPRPCLLLDFLFIIFKDNEENNKPPISFDMFRCPNIS